MGRFSGKNSAKRSLAVICATSDSTCEKSGLMVASIVVSALGVHLMSMPPSPSASSLSSDVPTPSRGALSWEPVT